MKARLPALTALVLAALPLGIATFWASRPWAVHFPNHLTTVGQMVLVMTPFREHRHSSYRWTRNEIAFKVRLIVAESFGAPFDRVRPESTFEELMR